MSKQKLIIKLFGCVSWHIKHCRLFNAKSCWYTYIKYIWFGLVGFDDISTIEGYLMSNPVYTYIFIYMICKHILQVQFWLQTSNNTGILNTCTRLWLRESEKATPVDSIKDVVRSSRVRQTLEEGRRTYAPKDCGNNNKDEEIVRKPLLIKIIKLRFRNLDN